MILWSCSQGLVWPHSCGIVVSPWGLVLMVLCGLTLVVLWSHLGVLWSCSHDLVWTHSCGIMASPQGSFSLVLMVFFGLTLVLLWSPIGVLWSCSHHLVWPHSCGIMTSLWGLVVLFSWPCVALFLWYYGLPLGPCGLAPLVLCGLILVVLLF